MEKNFEVKAIGKSSLEKKEQATEEIKRALYEGKGNFSPQEEEKLSQLEYPKSKEEIDLIDFANRETSKLMNDLGLTSYDVPFENFRIVPPELYKKITDGGGVATTFNKRQVVFFDAEEVRDKLFYFGAVALHEMLHLKAFLLVEVNDEGEKTLTTPYRESVSIRSLQKFGLSGRYHVHFLGLHEAIVSEMEKRLLPKLLDHSSLKKEKQWLSSPEAVTLKKELAQKEHFSEDDIIWISKTNKEDWNILSYGHQRRVLSFLCEEIKKQFPQKFKTEEEVFRLFLQAHFDGRLLIIARLIEETFGEGSFRMLGNMGADKNSGFLHFESFKKARIRQKNSLKK